MNGKGKASEHERRDWIIILIVLLFGFLCVVVAGEQAVRFAPYWKLDTNMQSNLDPDSDFLTNKPVGYHGPLDPSILTQPSWINVFLTPGAFFETRVPQVATNTPTGTNTPIPTLFFTPTAIRPSPTSTSVIFPPFPTSTRTSPPATSVASATPSPTRTPINSADLQVAKGDGATHYIGDAVKTYTIVVTNAGPSDVTGATVVDTFSTNPNIASANWTCFPSGSSTCTPSGTGDINDTVNIPASGSITYLVTVQVVPIPSGSLDNTATVTEPPGVTDPAPGNNSATDSDTLITPDPPPPNIGAKDNITYILTAGSTLTLRLSSDLIANGHPGADLVYYEYSLFPTFDGIWLDWIVIEISDGSNWYVVFNWGDNFRDTNTNVDYMILTPPVPPPNPEEMDERRIAAVNLYPYDDPYRRGITIDIDSIVPPGTYTYIRFYAPPDGNDNQAEIDAIEILP